MGEGGIKNGPKNSDVFYGRPLSKKISANCSNATFDKSIILALLQIWVVFPIWMIIFKSCPKSAKSAKYVKLKLLTTSHLLLEHLDHVVKVACTTNFSQHGVELTLVHQFTNVVEGSAEVRFAEGAVFVDIHKFEAFLVHINLLLGETAIVTLAHDCCLDESRLLEMN